MVWGLNPGGGEIFCSHLDWPWDPPSLLYNGYRVSFLGAKRPGRGVDHPPQSSARFKERVELYLYSPSGPSWPVPGRTLPLLYILLGVNNFYSLLSNSTYLILLFDIITAHVEVLVITGHKVLYALFIEVGRLGREPFLNALLQLDVALELLTSKKSPQVQEQMMYKTLCPVTTSASTWVVIMSKSRLRYVNLIRMSKNCLHQVCFIFIAKRYLLSGCTM
jgi:hypothetical protein